MSNPRLYNMRKMKFWMLTAIFACGAAIAFTSCVANDDNAGAEPTVADVPKLEIDPSEFSPADLDVNVALLGSLSSSAEDEAVRYWFPKVTGQVTDETQVVITDEITAGNKDDIIKVLDRFGMLLVVDPKEDNVRQYGEYFGVDPSDDYSKIELLGLTGFGDKFVSYKDSGEGSSEDILAPSSILSDDIWNIAPEEYLRLKAFAQWVDRIDKKYTEYQKFLEDYAQAIIDSDEDEEAASRALMRSDDKEKDDALSGIINILNLPGEDISVQAFGTKKFKSFDNASRSRDEDYCTLSVTCNYHIKPLFEFPSEKSPGADYYIVEASVGWDCTETFMGFKFHDHGSGTDRRSYLFFPIRCRFWSEPITTSGNYNVMVTTNGELWPGDVKPEKQVTNSRSFTIDGNVSGGISAGRENGSSQTGEATTNTKGSNLGANLDLGLGIGASWSKQESFTTAQYEVNPYMSGATVGHVISVPGGEDGWRPRKGDPYFEVPGGVNFRKTIPVSESWIWKVSGTQVDTYDNALTIQFKAEPTVAWYSYFLRAASIDEEQSTAQIKAKNVVSVPAPNRQDAGFLKILANTEENGKGLKVFGVKATDVTNAEKKVVVYDMPASTKFGKTLTVGLPANKTYDIELQMGTKRSNPKTYILKGWKVVGRFSTIELETDSDFDLKE